MRKTITLTEQQDQWIAEQIADGAYTNDSEAIRDLIRRPKADGLQLATSCQLQTSLAHLTNRWRATILRRR